MSTKGLATSAQGWDPAVGREGFPELLEELGILMGLNAPTEAERLRRICSIVCRNADRTWVVNPRGDVWEITNRLRRTPPRKPLADPTRLFPAPTLRLPVVPCFPPTQVEVRASEDGTFLDHLCSFWWEQGGRSWVVGPRGTVHELTKKAVAGPVEGTSAPASSPSLAPTLLAPTLPTPAEAAHAA